VGEEAHLEDPVQPGLLPIIQRLPPVRPAGRRHRPLLHLHRQPSRAQKQHRPKPAVELRQLPRDRRSATRTSMVRRPDRPDRRSRRRDTQGRAARRHPRLVKGRPPNSRNRLRRVKRNRHCLATMPATARTVDAEKARASRRLRAGLQARRPRRKHLPQLRRRALQRQKPRRRAQTLRVLAQPPVCLLRLARPLPAPPRWQPRRQARRRARARSPRSRRARPAPAGTGGHPRAAPVLTSVWPARLLSVRR
jgi:hypothetical protein